MSDCHRSLNSVRVLYASHPLSTPAEALDTKIFDSTNTRARATRWAHHLLARQNWWILDTETTGLGTKAEIIQIAAVDCAGNALIDSLVKPTVEIEPKAYRVHGISQARVEKAKPFDLVLLDALKALGEREVVVYNSSFDLRMIHQSLKAHGLYFQLPEKS